MRLVEDRSLARPLAIQKTVRASDVETQHPIANHLQTNTANPRRITLCLAGGRDPFRVVVAAASRPTMHGWDPPGARRASFSWRRHPASGEPASEVTRATLAALAD